jgi:hypothetical protein
VPKTGVCVGDGIVILVIIVGGVVVVVIEVGGARA